MERNVTILLVSGLCVLGGLIYFSCQPSRAEKNIPDDRLTKPTPIDPKECDSKVENLIDDSTSTGPTCTVTDLKKHPEILEQLKRMKIQPPVGNYPIFTNSHGLPDLSSAYLGGTITIGPDTTPFVPPNSICGSSGCPNVLDTVLEPDLIIPGRNWRFSGEKGSFVIELSKSAFITGFTLIHPRKRTIPDGYFTSAPKVFYVYGKTTKNDKEQILLGKYHYRENGPPAQTFMADSKCIGTKLKIIVVNFMENHGNDKYTAIYRFEVHGELESETSNSAQN